MYAYVLILEKIAAGYVKFIHIKESKWLDITDVSVDYYKVTR